jgi:serine/threonine protein kinase
MDPEAPTLPPPDRGTDAAEIGSEAVTVPPRPSSDELADAVPVDIGGYRLIRILGEGGMGTVYEAEDSASGQRVALKLISARFALSPDAVKRFRREGRLASTIAHSRCVFVLAADEEAGQPYIAMELMPGDTLQTLVKEFGPAPPERAVATILDVIDGLHAAHQVGIIHRDVKPSNCFLERDGRVKIGDFGLAKPLVSDEQLTTTGMFLGTPLYASPEQIKKEPLDERSDVYSVAATLFYLLIGRAPFQSGDATVTMARIVSDPPPSLRDLRPGIPPALDRVVLRGLERSRERRWQSMDQFRVALLPFAPGQLSIASLPLRWVAFNIIDRLLIVLPTGIALATAKSLGDVLGSPGWLQSSVLSRAISELAFALPQLLYFTYLEGTRGWSLGKRWLRLRVFAVGDYGPPGPARGFLRWFLLYTFLGLPFAVLCILGDLRSEPLWALLCGQGLGFLGGLILIATMRARNGYRGLHELLSGTRVVRLRPSQERLLSPPHRAVRSRVPQQRPYSARPVRETPDEKTWPRLSPHLVRELDRPQGLPERLGAFQIQGMLRWPTTGKVLVGRDATLERDVLLWLRRPFASPLTPQRRAVSRATRLRWVASGSHEGMQWDALLIPMGRPLSKVLQSKGRLFWPEVRPILEQLTDELVEACREGTLPSSVTTDQVWVQANGHLQLLDFPYSPSSAIAMEPARRASEPLREQKSNQPGTAEPDTDSLLEALPADEPSVLEALPALEADQVRMAEARALSLLRQVATLALEGCLRPAGEPFSPVHAPVPPNVPTPIVFLLQGELSAPVRAPVPLHAARLLNRLFGVRQVPKRRSIIGHVPYRRPAQLQADLVSTADKPTQVSGARRAAQLAQPTWALALGSMLFFGSVGWWLDPNELEAPLAFCLGIGLLLANAWPMLWVCWAFLMPGWYDRPFVAWFYLSKLALVRSDGGPPGSFQCAGRACLVWAPVSALLSSSLLIGLCLGELKCLSFLIWFLTLPVLVCYFLLAICLPSRCLHDRLAGTYLVPE